MSAERYDPATGSWVSTLGLPGGGGTPTKLQSGQVLTMGLAGTTDITTTRAVYDPTTNTWASKAPMSVVRTNHTATLLPTGKVLVAGGWRQPGYVVTSSAELYSPVGYALPLPIVPSGASGRPWYQGPTG